MDFIPYKYNECFEHSYYQIPQELFENKIYKYTLDLASKMLYAFILDRLTLSQKNHWVDEEGNLYLIFTRKEVEDKLALSEKTVIKAFKQLNDLKLISEKRQGLGRPNLIYVGRIQHEEIPEQEILQVKNCKNYSSGTSNSTGQELENLQGINTNNIKTNIINTESINPNSEDDAELIRIKDKCNLKDFTKEEQVILEDVIDGLYNKENFKIGHVVINKPKIIEKLKLIEKENLIQLLDILNKTDNIQNINNYLMTCLYNNLGKFNNTKSNKKINPNQRDYSEFNFDSLYANKDML